MQGHLHRITNRSKLFQDWNIKLTYFLRRIFTAKQDLQSTCSFLKIIITTIFSSASGNSSWIYCAQSSWLQLIFFNERVFFLFFYKRRIKWLCHACMQSLFKKKYSLHLASSFNKCHTPNTHRTYKSGDKIYCRALGTGNRRRTGVVVLESERETSGSSRNVCWGFLARGKHTF